MCILTVLLRLVSPYFPSSIRKHFSTASTTLPSPPPDGNIQDLESHALLLDMSPQSTLDGSALLPSPTSSAWGACDEAVPQPVRKTFVPSSNLSSQSDIVSWLQQNAGPPVPATPPKNVTDLPRDIIAKILENIFTDQWSDKAPFLPSYRQGMLAGYVRVGACPVAAYSDEVERSNLEIPISVMQTCRLFHEISCNIFYGRNMFSFRDPHTCRWWLKHIGPKNVSYLRVLDLKISSGLAVAYDVRSCFDLTAEENWLQLFQYLRIRHQLHSLTLHLDPNLPFRLPETERDGNEILFYRSKLNLELQKWRGVRIVKIHDPEEYLGNARNRSNLELLMSQSKTSSSTLTTNTKKPMSLAALIQDIRVDNMMRHSLARPQGNQETLQVDQNYQEIEDTEAEEEDSPYGRDSPIQPGPFDLDVGSSLQPRPSNTTLRQDFASQGQTSRPRHYGRRYHGRAHFPDF